MRQLQENQQAVLENLISSYNVYMERKLKAATKEANLDMVDE